MWKPANLKGIARREIQLEHKIHKKRLTRVSSRIDNTPPKQMRHLSLNSKGKYLEESKKNLINSSNKILVDRMLKVTSRRSSLTRPTKHSLLTSRPKQTEELSRITNENFRLFHRLNTCKPHYPIERSEQQYKVQNRIKQRISYQNREPKKLNHSQILFNPAVDKIQSVKCLNGTNVVFVL